jgi:hypothetical protein
MTGVDIAGSGEMSISFLLDETHCCTRRLGRTRAARRCNEVVDGADSALRPWKIFAKQDAGVSSEGVPNDTPS